tara:strand:+ start:162 stop:683 length:522 start_codon:yes stop_codon:yes gene_type:complete
MDLMMIGDIKYPIILSEKQKSLLKQISRGSQSSHAHRIRSSILLLLSQGVSHRKIIQELRTSHGTINRWKSRWYLHKNELSMHDERLSGKAYRDAILNFLGDNPRPGCPEKFSSEQVCQIISVASEKPEDSDLPLSHWSLQELANELVRRGIVESISTSQLSVFLKSGRDKTT